MSSAQGLTVHLGEDVVPVKKGPQVRFLKLTLHGRNDDPVVAFERHHSGDRHPLEQLPAPVEMTEYEPNDVPGSSGMW